MCPESFLDYGDLGTGLSPLQAAILKGASADQLVKLQSGGAMVGRITGATKKKTKKKSTKKKSSSSSKGKYKNIRIKKKGGGTRMQRGQVLASGKYKFVKNK